MILATQLWGGTDAVFYKVLLSLHIVMVVVAFGTAFVHSALLRIATSNAAGQGQAAAKTSLDITTRFSLPALIIAIVAGVAMIIGSGGRWGFDEPWISGSFSVVLILGLVLAFVMLPAQRQLVSANGDDQANKALLSRIKASVGITHLSLLILVVLMTWKPGM